MPRASCSEPLLSTRFVNVPRALTVASRRSKSVSSIHASLAGFHDRAANGVSPSTVSELAMDASRAPAEPRYTFTLWAKTGTDVSDVMTNTKEICQVKRLQVFI